MKSLTFAAVMTVLAFFVNSDHFKVENNNIVWQKVFRTEASINDVHQALQLKGDVNRLKIEEDVLFFELTFDNKQDLHQYGYRRGSYPSYLGLGGKYSGYVQVKDGRYRVTVNNVQFIDDINGLLLDDLTANATRKGKVREGNRTRKVLNVFDAYFSDKFDVTVQQLSNSDW